MTKENNQEKLEEIIKIITGWGSHKDCFQELEAEIEDYISQHYISKEEVERIRKEGYETGFTQAEVKQGLPKPLYEELRQDTAREIVEMLKGEKHKGESAWNAVIEIFIALIKQKYRVED